jgi:periplasmic divalent cation tolerance protein
MTDYVVALVTAGNMEEAKTIASRLVEEKLAACVNIVPGVRSIYFWEGEVCDDGECLLLIKTHASTYEALQNRVVQGLHSYDVPEVIAVPITEGFDKYLDFVKENSLKG